MKIGPMKQNPGWVLCHIFMVGLLSQVMDNAIVNVNVVKAKDSAILSRGKTQPMSSQVVEMNVVNKVNPGQVLQNSTILLPSFSFSIKSTPRILLGWEFDNIKLGGTNKQHK
jgi:hypothetical protein